MRHRIAALTGLGNSDPILLDNKGKLNDEFGHAALEAYFEHWGYLDYQIEKDRIAVGVEPTYQYEQLKIVSIHRDKDKSFIQTGKAWGPYGSNIVSNLKTYGEYKRSCKFVRFVDKWHEMLFNEVKVNKE